MLSNVLSELATRRNHGHGDYVHQPAVAPLLGVLLTSEHLVGVGGITAFQSLSARIGCAGVAIPLASGVRLRRTCRGSGASAQ